MDNESFFNYIKKKYLDRNNSLNELSILDNKLSYSHDPNTIKRIFLKNVKLSQLDETIFLLNSSDIYDIIRLLELYQYINILLEKKEITNEENKLIDFYLDAYINIYPKTLDGSINGKDIYYCFLPVDKSYDVMYQNSPCAMSIINKVDQYYSDSEKGRGNQKRLVLTPPNFYPVNEEEDDLLANIEKAGFTTIAIILIGIVATCLYIAFFVLT